MDVEYMPPDLVTPPMTDEAPAPGKRVRQVMPEYKGTDVHHALYLPVDWSPEKIYPVIVEYTGNKWASSGSTGRAEDANLGYGMSGGRGFIWVSMPYVNTGRKENALTWWGDRRATVDYCKSTSRVFAKHLEAIRDPSFFAASQGALSAPAISALQTTRLRSSGRVSSPTTILMVNGCGNIRIVIAHPLSPACHD